MWKRMATEMLETGDMPVGTLVSTSARMPDLKEAYHAPFPDKRFKAGPLMFPQIMRAKAGASHQRLYRENASDSLIQPANTCTAAVTPFHCVSESGGIEEVDAVLVVGPAEVPVATTLFVPDPPA